MFKVFAFLLFIVFVADPPSVQDCRRNEIDCIGLCKRFVDKNGDGFCDLGGLSQPAAASTEIPQNNLPAEPPRQADAGLLAVFAEKKEKPAATNPVGQPEELPESELHVTETLPEEVIQETIQGVTDTEQPSAAPKPYNLLLITALTLGGYLCTHLMKRFGLIRQITHRRIWNTVLLITFLFSGLLGLMLVVQINYNILGDWYLLFLDLHVEFGISMALVSVIHALWHVKYYKQLFKAR